MKKTGELRLIQDCRPLNKAMNKPPNMFLPLIHDIIRDVLSSEYVGCADAISMFYQFGLSETIQQYFAVLLSGGRGITVEGRFTRMPMGFSFAPCIGQRCANVLIRDLGRAWVDNFLVMAKTQEQYEKNRATFLERCAKVGMQLDSTDLTPQRQFCSLGVAFDLDTKLYKLDPEWAEKSATKLSNLVERPMTVRQLYECANTITWRNHVMKRSLCYVPYILNGLSVYGSRIAHKTIGWEDIVDVSPELLSELRMEIAILRENAPRGLDVETKAEVDIWTDASLSHAAYLIFRNHVLIASGQIALPDQHIFYSELYTAIEALKHSRRLGHKSANIFIDNAPAAICVERRVSSNFAANRKLATLPNDLSTRVTWVDTTSQLADPYTRPATSRHKFPPSIPPIGTPSQVFIDTTTGANDTVRARGLHTF